MEYQEAIKRSKIPRLPWKKILGESMGSFIKRNYKIGKEELVVCILKKAKNQSNILHIQGREWAEIIKNVEIGVSARLAELKIYGVNK